MGKLIWLYAAGGRALGMGNVIRTAALAEAFADGGWSVRLFISTDSPDLISHLQCAVTAVFLSDVRNFWDRLDAAPNPPHVVLWDNRYLTSADVKRAKSRGVQFFVTINDTGEGRSACDLLLDENERIIPPSPPPHYEGIFLFGAEYRIIRPEVARLRPSRPREMGSIRSVLISCGGADPGMCTAGFLSQLSKTDGVKTLKYTVVIGPCFSGEHISKIKRICFELSETRIEWSPPDLASLMLKHDAFIGLGGVSAYESMCLGCPCLLIEWSFMKEYVIGLVQRGWAANLGEAQHAATSLLDIAANPSVSYEMAARAWHGVDGNGRHRVVQAINQLFAES